MKIKNKETGLIFLPNGRSPELEIYGFLNSLYQDDGVWSQDVGGYSKAVFLNDKPSRFDDRGVMKKWLQNQREKWGKKYDKNLLTRYKELNPEIVNKFNVDFAQLIKKFS